MMRALDAWQKYLEKTLTFPFDAVVSGYQDKGPLQSGDRVSVKKISIVDDIYGIIIELRRGQKNITNLSVIWRSLTSILQTINP
jgi:hypothetical protein